jgi:bifunctional oligoribonuclease and PAP phosphatase NrnA
VPPFYNDPMLDWTPFVEMVRGHRRFLLTTHIRPDGDGLGSKLALAEALEHLGKQVHLVIASNWPPRYDFLDPDKRIQRFSAPPAAGDPLHAVDMAIVLDTGTWNQLGDLGPFLKSLNISKAVIDHHPTQDDLGAVRFVDTSAEATGRLAYEAIEALDVPVSERMANVLLVALGMDTGWFRHSNTTAATFALASKLAAAGAQPAPLHDQLFENNTLARLKLMGLVLTRLQTVEAGRVAFSEIRLPDYQATGAIPPDSEDLVNYTRSITGVEVGLLFMEQAKGGIKVSFRSRSAVDVNRIAEQFGGGGHRRASGATLAGSLEEVRARVLAAVHDALTP